MFDEIRKLVESYNGENDFISLNLALKNLLGSIISDNEILSEIASNSYRHQLGFEKYNLYTFSDGFSLRLHYWHKPEYFKEDIHSHCADFKSIVIKGSLINNIFILKVGETSKIFSYHFDENKKISLANDQGKIGFELKEKKLLLTSDTYFQSNRLLHRINEVCENTITLSLWNNRDSSALVLKNLNSTPDDCNCTSKFKMSEVIEKFNFIIRYI